MLRFPVSVFCFTLAALGCALPAVAQTADSVPAPAVQTAPVVASPELSPPAVAISAPAPAKASTAKASTAKPPSVTPSHDPAFPRYEKLKPAIAFWTKIFGDYSEYQSVVHSKSEPSRVYQVLDFRGDVVALGRIAAVNRQSHAEKQAKERVESLLRAVHEKRHDAASLSAEERRIYDLFPDITDDARFKRAFDDVRSQRGLKERTLQALEVSDKYLPEMEKVFASYGLPKILTRLPLVESSFNVEAYSKVGAAGLWQFMPSSARMYMRLNDLVDDRRDPWTSTDAAARHLRDDYRMLGAWPLALTAYNHGRGGISRGLREVGGTTLMDLIERYERKSFGFASKNFYAEFIAATDVEREYRRHQGDKPAQPLRFEVVETRHYVPYDTLRRLSGGDDEMFRKLNPAYRPEVIEGKLYVPPGHLIRVPSGNARAFDVSYSRLGADERFDSQRVHFLLYKVKKGDSLGRIAQRHGVTMASIASANGLKKNGLLRAGQVLRIAPHTEKRPGPITVAEGESKPQQTRAQRSAERTAGVKYTTHKVKSGQTLSGIAKRYSVSVTALREANDISGSHLRPGMRLKVPSKS